MTVSIDYIEGVVLKEPRFVKPNGYLLATLTIKVSYLYNKEQIERIFNVDFWNKKAEFIRDNIKKGDTVIIFGGIPFFEPWVNDQGEPKIKEIILDPKRIVKKAHTS